MVLSENGPIEAFPSRALLQYIRISSDLVHRVRERRYAVICVLLLVDTGPRVFPLYSLHGPSKSVFSKNSQRTVESFRKRSFEESLILLINSEIHDNNNKYVVLI